MGVQGWGMLEGSTCLPQLPPASGRGHRGAGAVCLQPCLWPTFQCFGKTHTRQIPIEVPSKPQVPRAAGSDCVVVVAVVQTHSTSDAQELSSWAPLQLRAMDTPPCSAHCPQPLAGGFFSRRKAVGLREAQRLAQACPARQAGAPNLCSVRKPHLLPVLQCPSVPR